MTSEDANLVCGADGSNTMTGIGKWCFFDGTQFHTGEVPDASTCNVSEYHALINLLKYLVSMEECPDRILILMDSALVVNQVNGDYRVRVSHLKPLHAEACELIAKIDCELQWVPRTHPLMKDIDARSR